MKPFPDQYDLKEMRSSSHKKYWKKCQSNYKLITLNVSFIENDKKRTKACIHFRA